MGLIPQTVDISGDGTCIETGASHYGKKVCDCMKNRIFKCDCPRKFSDPNATWGWDSHNEHYFYGYTGYFICTYITTISAINVHLDAQLKFLSEHNPLNLDTLLGKSVFNPTA